MRKHWLILLFLLVPAVVLGVGSAKRIINLPGFTTDRVLIVNSSGEIDDTAVSEAELNLLDGVSGTLVTEAGTATLTNKTIDADGTGNSITNIENADIKSGAAIARDKIADGTADHVVINDGSGTFSSEATLAKSRGGAGADMSNVTFPSTGTLFIAEKNVNKNFWPDYQAVTTSNVAEDGDYTTYAGTPDNSAAQLSVSSETTDELSGTESYSLDKSAADASGQAWILELDTPDRLCTTGGNTHYLTFKYETSANYDNSADERVELFTYGNSSGLQACNARDTLSGTFSNNLPVAPDSGQYQCTYSCASGDTQIDVVLAYTGTATQAVDIVIDEIRAGPDAVVTAPIVTEWQSYDVNIQGSGSNPTKATTTVLDQGYWRRNGDSIDFSYIYVHTDNTGAAAGSGTYSFNLPSQCTVDTTKVKITGAGGLSQVGTAVHFSTTSSTNATGVVSLSTTSRVIVIVGNAAAGDNSLGSTTYPLNDASWYMTIRGTVPCEEYANSNAILSTTQADHQTVKVEGADNGGEGISADVTNIVFTEVTDTNNAWDGSQFTAPSAGRYAVSGLVRCTTSASRGIYFYTASQTKYASTNAYSGSIHHFAGFIDLDKGEVLSIRSDAACTLSSSASTHHISITSQPDFSTFSTYGPYEYTEAECSSTTTTTTATTFVDATGASISLTPGTWQVCYDASVYNEWISGTPANSCQSIIRDGSNNSVNGSSKLKTEYLDSTYPSQVSAASSCVEVTHTETTTYKLSLESSNANTVARCSFWCGGNWTGGLTAPDGETKIWARRMK